MENKWQLPFLPLWGERSPAGSPAPEAMPLPGRRREAASALPPVMEGPEVDRRKEGWGQWLKDQFAAKVACASAAERHDELRLLLGVMAAPLAPVRVAADESLPLISVKNVPIEQLMAQYIVHQYVAASGGETVLSAKQNSFAKGRLMMSVSGFEAATTRGSIKSATAEAGGFVLWQMAPEMWYLQLRLGDKEASAGCDGRLIWRYVPWHGVHAAKGPARPIRRALQGLHPLATAKMFSSAIYVVQDKIINGEACFVLKHSADDQTVKARSQGAVEVIRHTTFGYFSQRTGLLLHLADTHLTRTHPVASGDTKYWESTTSTSLGEYRLVDGVMIAHAGCSSVVLKRFGDEAISHKVAKMEEQWEIEDAKFDVNGITAEFFIPPSDLKMEPSKGSVKLPPGAKRM